MRIPVIVDKGRRADSEGAALIDLAADSLWCSTLAALLYPRGHLRYRNGGEGGVMHSSCNRLPHTVEAFREAADPCRDVVEIDESPPFVHGLMWAFGFSAVFWIGLGSLLLK